MNDSDFEQHLSRLPLRTPPPTWRGEILGTIPQPKPEPAWTWRDWLWPSPFAWGALAAVWVACFAIDLNGSKTPVAVREMPPPAFDPNSPPLYAFQFGRQLAELPLP